MIKKYGVLGIILIVLIQINFFLKIEPFASWYFPIVWFGYILVIDALVYMVKGSSLISSRFKRFLGMVIISAMIWWVFEFINISLQNWSYMGTESVTGFKALYGFLSFATVLPALFETTELIMSVHLFDKFKLRKKHKISKSLLYSMIVLGVLCFFLPLVLPKFAFPLVWLSFFFILDPINYMNKQPSIIGHIKDKKIGIILSLLLAGIILGFLWEFWNYQSVIKWTYDIPFVSFFKIFEMPILGYLGYFPFALELYAMYWFVRSLFLGREKMLV